MTGTQVDLFLDQLVDAPIKDERALMAYPFFSLQKQPRRTPFVYDDGRVRILIEPGPRGIATIWDKDVLIYLSSIVNDRLERGMPLDRTITFAAHDFLKVTGRGTGKRAYDLFLDALHRLRSTNITTTIESGGEKERRGFGWIEDWRVIERTNARGKRVMAGVEVTLNRWMFNAIVKDRRILTINREYFGLSKGLERRLYELARKHVGNQFEWYISLARLAEKCGTTGTLRKFKVRLAEIIEAGTIPDYTLALVLPGEGQSPFKSKDGNLLVWFTPLAAPLEAAQLTIAKADMELPQISNLAYDEAHRRFPGYDIAYLEQRWQEGTLAKGIKLKNPDKAFLAWCRTYTANNPL